MYELLPQNLEENGTLIDTSRRSLAYDKAPIATAHSSTLLFNHQCYNEDEPIKLIGLL